MAAVLFNMATLLKADPAANPYRVAAYERAGRAMMGLRKEAREILDGKDQITFRRRQHIGKRLHAKIGEMAASGDLAQFGEFLQAAPVYVSNIVRGVPGIGPAFAERAHNALGVSSKEELVRAARDGRLRQVRGFGAARTARIAALTLPGDAVQLAFGF
jgi:DNA polymerase (family 10)